MRVERVLMAAAAVMEIAAPAAADAPKGWKTYTDAKAGWSISYPANFKVNRRYTYARLTPAIPGVSFSVPGSYTKGTNLEEGTLSVETLPGKACKPAQFLDDTPEDIKPLKADGRSYISANYHDAGMSHLATTELFVIEGTCTAVRYLASSVAAGALDPMPKEYDPVKLDKLFDSIRATLKLKGEH